MAEADADLATYMQQDGNVALRAMLTDGAAFCAFLRRGGGIDNALVEVAAGAHSVESQTHLPANVHTFNTLESVALIDLCPGEQRLVPALGPRGAAPARRHAQILVRLAVPVGLSGSLGPSALDALVARAGRGGEAFAPGVVATRCSARSSPPPTAEPAKPGRPARSGRPA